MYKFGILAFERLRVADKLSELEKLSADSLTHFGGIFQNYKILKLHFIMILQANELKS